MSTTWQNQNYLKQLSCCLNYWARKSRPKTRLVEFDTWTSCLSVGSVSIARGFLVVLRPGCPNCSPSPQLSTRSAWTEGTKLDCAKRNLLTLLVLCATSAILLNHYSWIIDIEVENRQWNGNDGHCFKTNSDFQIWKFTPGNTPHTTSSHGSQMEKQKNIEKMARKMEIFRRNDSNYRSQKEL